MRAFQDSGGHCGQPEWGLDGREKTGRELGYPQLHKMAEALGCHGEYVEEPVPMRPVLERAFKTDCLALVNVRTDWRAGATTAPFFRARDLRPVDFGLCFSMS